MTMRMSTTLRAALIQAIITAAGANPKGKLYNGAFPAALGTPAGTLLATVTFGTVLGVVSGATLDFDETVTQTNSSHVNGTPTFLRIETSGGTAVLDIDLGGTAPTLTFTGTVVNGQNVTLTSLVFTAPHA